METDSNTVMVICDSLRKRPCGTLSGPFRQAGAPDFDDRTRGRVFTKALSAIQALYRPMSESFADKEVPPLLPLLQRMYAYLKEREET